MARKQQNSTGKQGTVLHLISKKRVHTLAVSRIARIREKQRNKRNQNFIKRNNRKKDKKENNQTNNKTCKYFTNTSERK